jgi:DNA replication protein DnaC
MREFAAGNDSTAHHDFISSSVLIIDDLGCEFEHKNKNEYLHIVINERYFNNAPFIITTNLSGEHIKGRYDQRLAGRILDENKTVVIPFKGADLRGVN